MLHLHEQQQYARRCAPFSPTLGDDSRLRAVAGDRGSRTSGHRGRPVCAAARGPVSAGPLKGTLRGWTAPASRWAARRHSCPPEALQRARMDAAPCLTSPPPEGAQRSAPAPLRSARAAASCDPVSPVRGGSATHTTAPVGRVALHACRRRVVALLHRPGRSPYTNCAAEQAIGSSVFLPLLPHPVPASTTTCQDHQRP
jgi:hypothetical protein